MAREPALTDKEVGLIKTLLKRGYQNGDIQFFFNKPGRKVNSGRITEIKKGSRGKAVLPATEDELDHFLATAAPSHTAVVTVISPKETDGPLAKSRLLAMFERRPDGTWYLRDKETVNCEAKSAFWHSPLEKLAPAARAMAAFANSTGGYIFFGVSDDMKVQGLLDDKFQNADASLLSQSITGCLDPAPVYHKTTLEIEGRVVGVIYVESSQNKPVICLKNAGKLSEGTIYFRYPGESKAIKPGNLQQIIAEREARAVSNFAARMSQVAQGEAAFIDLDKNIIEGDRGRIVLDEGLAAKLTFIKEGEFTEHAGAPTLRLIGDVVSIGSDSHPQPHIVRDNITDESVLVNFLRQISVESPSQYIKHSCHSSKKWLPIFYYATLDSLNRLEVKQLVANETATYPSSQNHTLSRAEGGKRAYKKASGSKQRLLRDQITAQAVPPPMAVDDARDIATAIQCIETAEIDFEYVSGLLQSCHALAKGSGAVAGNLRSAVYKGACRLDELRFAP